jgi:hypothetical protein
VSFSCPVCGGKSVGQVGINQYYCWDCFVEYDSKNQVFSIAEDGTLSDYFTDLR